MSSSGGRFALNAAGSAWSVEQARSLRVRFGSPSAGVDALPDQYLVSVLGELEFAGDLPATFDADHNNHPHPKVADRGYMGKSNLLAGRF